MKGDNGKEINRNTLWGIATLIVVVVLMICFWPTRRESIPDPVPSVNVTTTIQPSSTNPTTTKPPTTKPKTTQPLPEPTEETEEAITSTVHPGAYCDNGFQRGVTEKGTKMKCAIAKDGEWRWQRQ